MYRPNCTRFTVAVCVVVSAWAFPSRNAHASFHLWDIVEVYSSSDGRVQYIELFTGSSGQQSTNNKTITANDGDGTVTFTFPSNTPSPTNNHSLLIATSNFDDTPGGVTPNFTLPNGFFDPNASSITINFVGADSVTLSNPDFDGETAYNGSGSPVTPTPRNYAGAQGFIDECPCDDDNPCTDDSCVPLTGTPGFCSFAANDGNDCDNGDFCDGEESCSGGSCTFGSDPCTTPPDLTCDEDNDECVECIVAADCDSPCQDCNGGVCENDDTNDCDNGDFCDGEESCSGGVCDSSGDPCPPGGEPDLDMCRESDNSCVECLGAEDCSDGLFCSGPETCSGAGTCQAGTPPCASEDCSEGSDTCDCATDDECDDGIACTVDDCDGGTCSNTPDNAECDDGLFCNGAETCDGATGCQAGSAPHCDDAIACTADSCNETTDACDNLPDHGACADTDICNGAEVCNPPGGCEAGAPADAGTACGSSADNACDDPDTCDGSGTCLANTAADHSDCTDDGLFCTGPEICEGGECMSEGDPCDGVECDETDDVCLVPCGNEVLDDDEECDDGNTDAGDGCDDACAIEDGWRCAPAEEKQADQCTPIENDGLVVGDEECDDGNVDPGDGCFDGLVEEGFICDDSEPSVCGEAPTSGDAGLRDTGSGLGDAGAGADVADLGVDAPGGDVSGDATSTAGGEDSGCCRTIPSPVSPWAVLLVVVGLGWLLARSRRRLV